MCFISHDISHHGLAWRDWFGTGYDILQYQTSYNSQKEKYVRINEIILWRLKKHHYVSEQNANTLQVLPGVDIQCHASVRWRID